MKPKLRTEKKFILAKNAIAANRILTQIQRGERARDKVFFSSAKEAYSRWSGMPLGNQKQFSVFEVNLVEKE